MNDAFLMNSNAVRKTNAFQKVTSAMVKMTVLMVRMNTDVVSIIALLGTFIILIERLKF